MAVISYALFALTFPASLWAIVATVAPEARRILDLLAHGPAVLPVLPAPVPARSTLRGVSVRRLAAPRPASPLRAAA